jgi:putative endopeptidase
VLVRAIDAAAPYLSQPFVEAEFGFNQTTLSGTPENKARWKRGVTLVKDSVGEDLGKQYVAKWFTPETKAAAQDLVKNVIAAMDRGCRTSPGWTPRPAPRRAPSSRPSPRRSDIPTRGATIRRS